MGKDERILLSVAFIGLAALLLAKFQNSGVAMIANSGRAMNVRNFNSINWQAVWLPSSVIQTAGASQDGVTIGDVPWHDNGSY